MLLCQISPLLLPFLDPAKTFPIAGLGNRFWLVLTAQISLLGDACIAGVSSLPATSTTLVQVQPCGQAADIYCDSAAGAANINLDSSAW